MVDRFHLMRQFPCSHFTTRLPIHLSGTTGISGATGRNRYGSNVENYLKLNNYELQTYLELQSTPNGVPTELKYTTCIVDIRVTTLTFYCQARRSSYDVSHKYPLRSHSREIKKLHSSIKHSYY